MTEKRIAVHRGTTAGGGEVRVDLVAKADGGITVAEQDTSPEAQAAWGDDDVETFLEVPAEGRDALLAALLAERWARGERFTSLRELLAAREVPHSFFVF